MILVLALLLDDRPRVAVFVASDPGHMLGIGIEFPFVLPYNRTRHDFFDSKGFRNRRIDCTVKSRDIVGFVRFSAQ